jgi:hypothetical protein
LEKTGVDGKVIFRFLENKVWIGLIWLRIGSGGMNLQVP